MDDERAGTSVEGLEGCRLLGLGRGHRPASAPASGLWAWLFRLPLLSRLYTPPPDSARLEDQVEAAQRRVLQLAQMAKEGFVLAATKEA